MTTAFLARFPAETSPSAAHSGLPGCGRDSPADWIGGQESAFTEDLDTRINIESQSPARPAHDENESRLPASGPESILKFANPPIGDLHGSCLK